MSNQLPPSNLKLFIANENANNKSTGLGSPLFKQLKAIQEAKELGICYKCGDDVEVDNNSVCGNCEPRDA